MTMNEKNENGNIVVDILVGPTASGKSAVAKILAERYGLEIVSLDSMKIYRGMDIGTSKPSKDTLEKIKYHMIDIIDPSDSYNVKMYVEDAEKIIKHAHKESRRILFVGGTALYFKGLTEGIFEGPPSDWNLRERLQERAQSEGVDMLYNELCEKDPKAAEKIQKNDIRRIVRALEVYEHTGNPISSWQKQFGKLRTDLQFRVVLLWCDREDLYNKINMRVEKMFDMGLADEVESIFLSEKGFSREAGQGIGYKEVIDYIEGKYDLPEAIDLVKRNTRHLARHQITWFRKFHTANNIEVQPSSTAVGIAGEVAQILYS